MISRISQIAERMKGIECPLCNGTRFRKAVSFADSSKTVEISCGNCKMGRIPASSEDLLEDISFLLEEREKMVELLRNVRIDLEDHDDCVIFNLGKGNTDDARCDLCKSIDALLEPKRNTEEA